MNQIQNQELKHGHHLGLIIVQLGPSLPLATYEQSFGLKLNTNVAV